MAPRGGTRHPSMSQITCRTIGCNSCHLMSGRKTAYFASLYILRCPACIYGHGDFVSKYDPSDLKGFRFSAIMNGRHCVSITVVGVNSIAT